MSVHAKSALGFNANICVFFSLRFAIFEQPKVTGVRASDGMYDFKALSRFRTDKCTIVQTLRTCDERERTRGFIDATRKHCL